MNFFLREQIRIGISACTYGAKVRYNRKGWDRTEKLGRERDAFIWTPICPEVNSGLGVMRPSVRLAGGNGFDFWDGKAEMVAKKAGNVTAEMKAGMLASLEILKRAGVEAFAFMEGSPSCGVYRTTLSKQRLGKPPGAFGALLLKEQIFLIPAIDMEAPVKWWDWRRRLHAFVWLQRQDLTGKKQIYEIWNNYKFLCQEIDNTKAREMGRQLAAMPKRLTKEFAENWRNEVLLLLRRPSTLPRIQASMQKHFAHYRKHVNPRAKELKPPKKEMSKWAFFEKLLDMEKRAVKEGFHFAGTPVIYRSDRR